jgi:hypothetical protein
MGRRRAMILLTSDILAVSSGEAGRCVAQEADEPEGASAESPDTSPRIGRPTKMHRDAGEPGRQPPHRLGVGTTWPNGPPSPGERRAS